MGRHSTIIASEAPIYTTHINVLTPPESPSSKKRKRDAHPAAEIEVDITAPEPPSKKTLRKAKKEGKAAPKAKKTDVPKEEAVVEENPQNEDSVATGKPSSSSEYGIWIGNLSWTTKKNDLRDFFAKNMSDAAASISRLHLPPPSQITLMNSPQKLKPQNKGFAYVDFSTDAALKEALGLSEKLFSGRKVLIKDAKSFEGRPEKPVGEAAKEIDALTGKPPSERIFVGNLRFETTKEEVQELFEKCGVVEDVFLATFEDSGKCKGYGWVTFEKVDAAKTAVRGWVDLASDSEEEEAEQVEIGVDAAEAHKGAMEHRQKAKKTARTRKWWVNRLHGRPLRTEFAEGKEVRYQKRYGKGGIVAQKRLLEEDSVGDGVMTAPKKVDRGSKAVERPGRRMNTARHQPKEKVDARSIKPGAALAAAPRLTGGIVESQGKKIIFES